MSTEKSTKIDSTKNSGTKNKKQAVLVLGMHRSGTSAFSRAVKTLGYSVGNNLMPASEDNQKGYWEDMGIVTLNEALLSKCHAAWDRPGVLRGSALISAQIAGHKDEIRALISKSFPKKNRIAIKDPRISLLSPIWRECLKDAGFSTKTILCLRHPQAVANSLNTRDHFSDLKSYHLWYHYNLALLEQAVDDVLVVSYENLLKNPESELKRIGAFLALDPDEWSAETSKEVNAYCREFIDSDLCRADDDISERFANAPAYLTAFYEALKKYDSVPKLKAEQIKAVLHASAKFEGDRQLQNELYLLHDELNEKGEAIKHYCDELQDAEAKIFSAIDIRNQTAEANAGLREANDSLKALNLSLQNQQKVLQSTIHENQQQHQADAQQHQKEIDEKVAELGRLTQTIADQQQTNQALQQQLKIYHESTSWRVTEPLRALTVNARNIKLAVRSAFSFVRYYGLAQLFANVMRIWRQEGVLGIKYRLKFGPAQTRSSSVPVVAASATGFGTFQPAFTGSAAIVKSDEGYSLATSSAGYTYIPPRKPANMMEIIGDKSAAPLFSIVVPLYNTPLDLLEKMIGSVESQWYPHWQLILADDASPSASVKDYLKNITHPSIELLYLEENQGIAGATNAAIDQARGDYIVLLDHDDELTDDCLFELAKCIKRDNPDFIYSDEDKIDPDGSFTQPHFKPGWSPDTMMSTMYTCHVACIRKSLLNEVGGLRSQYDGCQDWDLVLRITEATNRISHIPKVLYHWRIIPASIAADLSAKPYALEASKNVRLDALKRRGLIGELEAVSQVDGYFNVVYDLQNEPLISIIIPTRDNVKVLRRCIESIFKKSSYRSFEIIILDNGSIEKECLDYFEEVSQQEDVSVIRHDAPFNFSELNNIGAQEAKGELLLFLNDDTEVISADWLERMGGYAQLSHIGAVGAKLLYPEGNKIQHAGVLNLQDGPGHAFIRQDCDTPGYYMRNLLEYNWLAVTGACLMMEAKKFHSVGTFNEAFPVAYNDVDLCMRLCDQGLFNVVCQSVRLTHYESVSRGIDNIDPEKVARLKRELQALNEAHPQYFQYDPFYSVNLHPNGINFEVPQ
ncbi:glycosyltransferase [Alkalimarinus coralli]|uniref:glycosyltransferase n=1 Tax=Alkalimarinus coralli TaxID=2935863 RepID=UPI00202B472D|nr:glycosyltransferase [Alkalimarinus coralli]